MAIRTVPERNCFAWQAPVIDRHIATPPVSPSAGDRYIIPAGATGAWSTHVDDIAEWWDGVWNYYSPDQGWIAESLDEGLWYKYDGVEWFKVPIYGGDAFLYADYSFPIISGKGTPWIETTSNDYEVCGSFILRRTFNSPDLAAIKAVLNATGGTMYCRIYDYDNANIIAEASTTETSKLIVDLGTLSNVPDEDSLIEIQIKKAGTKGFIHGISVQY